MVHISEVADAYVKDIRDYLKQNDRVRVRYYPSRTTVR